MRAAIASARCVIRPLQLGEKAGDRRLRGAVEAGCDEFVVQRHRKVGPHLDDHCQRQQRIAGGRRAGNQIAQPGTADFQRGVCETAAIRVGRLALRAPVARARILAPLAACLESALLAQWHGQIYGGAAFAACQLQRRRRIGVVRNGERRAVRHRTAAGADSELSDMEHVAIDCQLGHAPAMRLDVAHGRLHQPLCPTIGLLKMLDAEEHALAPHDPVRG